MKKTLLAVAVLALPACGGGGGSSPTPVTTLPAAPAATLETTGNGLIEVHPSAVRTHSVAVIFPFRIRETAGGTATWNFVRVSYIRRGVEVERAERGADDIRAAGFADITARQDVTVRVTTRTNAPDWDTATITLGFSDKKDGRQFTTNVPFNSFSGVVPNLTPASLPAEGDVRIQQ
jgi:hypothetical protein